MEKDVQQFRALEYRISSASGTYPAQSLVTKSSALLVNQQLIVSIWNKEDEFAEDILNAGLLLATNLKRGFLKLYGFPFTHHIEAEFSEDLLDRIEYEIQYKIADKFVLEGDVLPEFDCYQNAKGASLPLIFNGLPYSKSEDLIDEESFNEITLALTRKINHDLLAITELLVISSKLSCHFQFQTEACHYLLVAVRKYHELDWAKPQPVLKEWFEQLKGISAMELAKSVSPIEYIRIYSGMINALKNSYLENA